MRAVAGASSPNALGHVSRGFNMSAAPSASESSEISVFLSYASEDRQALLGLVAELRSTGIDVWFDANELRGGDAWDDAIRRQIKTCTFFVAVISATTQQREEGYFRREWRAMHPRSMRLFVS